MHKHKYVLITGAMGHLGLVLSEILADKGYCVILTDIYPKKDFEENLCRNDRGSLLNQYDYYQLDLRNTTDIRKFIKTIKSNYDRLDGLVNNAAFVGSANLPNWNVGKFEQRSEVWKTVFDVNLFSLFDLSQELYPLLAVSDAAAIVNVSSIYGHAAPVWSIYEDVDITNPAGYGASKAGVEYITKWMASSFAPIVRVNCVAPGGIYRDHSSDFAETYSANTLLGRMATEKDIADPIAFLLSEKAAYINGQIIHVDGGWRL